MADLLSGTLLFLVAVFSHWQIWLSGSGVGGFLVIASSLIERLTGKSLSRKTHLLIFVVAFFLCSCIIAWIDEHDRGMRLEGQLRIANGSFAKYRTDCEKQMSDKQNDFLGQIGDLQSGVAVKEAVSQTLQKQNRDQQSTINGCLSQAMKLMTPELLKIWVWLLWNDAPAGGMKTAAILGGGISKANTLERRPSRWDKDVVDPVRCGIANSGQSLLRGRWL